ncbi:urease accessory UreF family protein [Georgenia sp. M64]|uniref:urease accessory protein UreF n=1 Tax=Georgenia sp. M64 TaxID=3120520 RepID=UPI0030E42AA1
MDKGFLAALLHSDSALPSGSFAFSWGLEQLYQDEVLGDDPLEDVLAWYLTGRWAGFDRYFVQRSFVAATQEERVGVDRYCTAATVSAVVRETSTRAGRTFLRPWSRMRFPATEDFAARVQDGRADGHLAVVQGLVFRECGMDEASACAVSGWSSASSLASAAVRLGKVGALAAQKALVGTVDVLEDLLRTPVPNAPTSWSVIHDLAMERHALRDSRLFAS